MKALRVLPLILFLSLTAMAQSNPVAQSNSPQLSILNLEVGYLQSSKPGQQQQLSPMPRTDWAALRSNAVANGLLFPPGGGFPARKDGTLSPQQGVIAERYRASGYQGAVWPDGFQTPQRNLYAAVMVVKNTSEKTIKAIDWDYLLLDPINHRTIKRNKLRTSKQIKPNETAALNELVSRPVGKSSARNNVADQRVSIRRIEYTDGSVWLRQ